MSANPACMSPTTAHGHSTSLEYAIRMIGWCDALAGNAWDDGRRPDTIARFMRRFGVSRSTAYRHINAYRAARGLS